MTECKITKSTKPGYRDYCCDQPAGYLVTNVSRLPLPVRTGIMMGMIASQSGFQNLCRSVPPGDFPADTCCTCRTRLISATCPYCSSPRTTSRDPPVPSRPPPAPHLPLTIRSTTCSTAQTTNPNLSPPFP